MPRSSRTVMIWRVRQMLQGIEDGAFIVPRFHRGFVWSDEQRLELLESMRHGVPIGSIVLLRTWQLHIPSSQVADPFPPPRSQGRGGEQYILDGFQRLATLYGALWVRREGKSLETERWEILYDLEQERFLLPPRHGMASPSCVELWRLFDARAFFDVSRRLVRAGYDDGRAHALRDVLSDYELPVLSLETESLQEVTQTTLRVNSFGTPWSELDMARAATHGAGHDVWTKLESLQEGLASLGWGDLEESVLLSIAKTAVGVDFGRNDPMETAWFLEHDGGQLDDLSPALKRVIRFLAETCGVLGPRVLPYRSQLILLVEAARKNLIDLTGDIADRLRKWFWQTTYTEYFKGATSPKLRRAREHLIDVLRRGVDSTPPDLDRRVEPIDRLRVGRVRTTGFLLFLSTLRPCSLDAELPAPEMLARGGLDAAPKIVGAQEAGEGIDTGGPENRWIMSPDLANGVRDAIARADGMSRVPIERLREGHAFSEDAVQCLARGDFRGMLEARRLELQRREGAFIETLGLEYVSTSRHR